MAVYRYERDGAESLAAAIAAACAAATDRSLATYRERVDELTAPTKLETILDPERAPVEPGQGTSFAVHECFVRLTVESTAVIRVEANPAIGV